MVENNYIVDRFKMMFESENCKVMDCKDIGDHEIIFYMSDGTKSIFDEFADGVINIFREDNENAELTDKEWLREFSRKLKKKMHNANISRVALSEKTGISYSTICRYVNGYIAPDVLSLKKISRALGCPIEQLTNFDYLL